MYQPVARRSFLQQLAGMTGGLALSTVPGIPASRGAAGRLQGIFPILQTPFTENLQIDADDFRKQIQFQIQCGTHGMVWPQLASEFFDLSVDERLEYAETLLRETSGRCPVVIGVQATETNTAVHYARHAHQHGANAVIALPPYASRGTMERVFNHYRTIAGATPLPVFIQISTGNYGPTLSVDQCLQLARECPTIRYIKEEVSPVPERVHQLTNRDRDLLHGVFTGGGGRHLLNEIRHGATGCMPAAHLTDVYVSIWKLVQTGRHAEARTAFNGLLALWTFGSLHAGFPKLILKHRGVFKTSLYRTGKIARLNDDFDRTELAELLDGVKPYMKQP
jgi:dihydrodipicolinate synthase/N-acetylneuraminate lyase